MDRLHALFGMYPSERVNIVNTGVHNAVYALGGMTFLELIQPYDPECAAMRLLERCGEGWHMTAFDFVPVPNEEIEAGLVAAGIRVVRRNKNAGIRGAWHLHPKDTRGVLIAAAIRSDREDSSEWAGKAFREYVATNTRVISSIGGISIACEDLVTTRTTYEALGFEFGPAEDERGDSVVTAVTPRGTFLQLRTPVAGDSIAALSLKQRGPGLAHLVLMARDLEKVAESFTAGGVAFTRERRVGGDRLWSDAATTFGIVLEVRESR